MNALKKLMIALGLFCFAIASLQAQKFTEIGLGLGTFVYNGDLTKNSKLVQTYNYSGHLFFRYNFNKAIAAKAEFGFGQISAWDYASAHRRRNLHFKSILAELSIVGQIDILALLKKDGELSTISPFLYGGVAGFYYNPKAKLDGTWHALQPLGTEGQGMAEFPDRKPYSLFQVSIPFGVDLRYNMSRKLFMGVNLGFRKTFTDYLDDVSTSYVDNSALENANGALAAQLADRRGELTGENIHFPEGAQRGDSSNKDWYYVCNVYLTYNFISKRSWKTAKKNAF